MERLTVKRQHKWKRLVMQETFNVLSRAGFDLQTDFYEVPIVGIMTLNGFPYQKIREVLAALYWGARGFEYSDKGIDVDFYNRNPHLILYANDRLKVLRELGCFKDPDRFYDLTIQQLLSAIYYSPSYIEEYSLYYMRFYERKNLGQVLCFADRADILNRYQPFARRKKE